MNTAKVAAALNTISLAFGELAEALSEAPQALRTAQEPSPFVDLPDEVFAPTGMTVSPAPQGSLSQCPSHRIAYLSGRYGFYCPARSEDPAWANKKGYCTITPDNAADWLRITAA
jgi:hypothetical protein